MTKDEYNTALVPPSTEAFLCVLLENCHPKWVWMCEEIKKDSKVDFTTKDMKEHEMMKSTLYTCSDSGQQRFGGWSDEGLKRFSTLTKAIKEARSTPKSLEIEKKILDTIREKAGIKSGSAAEEHKKKRRKKGEKKEEVEIVFDDE